MLCRDLERARDVTAGYFGPSPTPPKAQSLFWPVPLRTCKDLQIVKDPDFCICSKWKSLPPTDSTVRAVAEHALAIENENLAPFRNNNTLQPNDGHFCQTLTLKSIESTTVLESTSYTISLTTNEGYPVLAKFSVDISFQSADRSAVTSLRFYQLTTFSVYKSCRPMNAPSHTCICNVL